MKEEDKNLGQVQEKQNIDTILRWSCTLLGLLIVVGTLASTVMHFFQQTEYPKPKDLEAGLLLGIGLVLIVLFNLPWTKIRVGEVEIERAIEEQAIDYAEEIDTLKKKLSDCKDDLEKVGQGSPQVQEKLNKAKIEEQKETEDEKLLISFLKKWPTWGFTATRIINWGSKQKGFEGFKDFSKPRIRMLAAKLIRNGNVRTRVSKNNNVLYQYNA